MPAAILATSGWAGPVDQSVFALSGGHWQPNAHGVQIWVADEVPEGNA